MSNLRRGRFGDYYGSYYSESGYLTNAQMEINALYIYSYFKHEGWSDESIAGMLGNMQAESTLNPGCWESHNIGDMTHGYGLVQWTPATNYINWCSGDASEIDNQLDRIIYELENGLQFYPSDSSSMTFREFTKSTKSPSELAYIFLKNYERASVEVIEKRKANANAWYSYLTGKEPATPGGSGGGAFIKKKKGFKFHLFRKVI